jgi:plastocyanin
MTRLALIVAVALALLIAGCGGGSSSNSSSSAGTWSGAATVDIKMSNIQFVPSKQAVKVGQKVTWTNDDGVDHNVVAKSGASFKSGNFGKGGTFTYTPKKAGTISYVCTIHPGMDGTLTVTK